MREGRRWGALGPHLDLNLGQQPPLQAEHLRQRGLLERGGELLVGVARRLESKVAPVRGLLDGLPLVRASQLAEQAVALPLERERRHVKRAERVGHERRQLGHPLVVPREGERQALPTDGGARGEPCACRLVRHVLQRVGEERRVELGLSRGGGTLVQLRRAQRDEGERLGPPKPFVLLESSLGSGHALQPRRAGRRVPRR